MKVAPSMRPIAHWGSDPLQCGRARTRGTRRLLDQHQAEGFHRQQPWAVFKFWAPLEQGVPNGTPVESIDSPLMSERPARMVAESHDDHTGH